MKRHGYRQSTFLNRPAVSRTCSYYPNCRLQTVSESVGGVSNLVATIDEYNRLRAASVGVVATTWGYSATTNLLSQIKATGVQQYDYRFDAATGNLNSCQNSQGNRLINNRIKIKASGNRGFSYGL